MFSKLQFWHLNCVLWRLGHWRTPNCLHAETKTGVILVLFYLPVLLEVN